jgi:dipeptidyl-peptidase-4
VVAATGVTTWIDAGNSPDVLMARVYWLPDSSAIALETAPRLQNALELLFCDPKTGSTRSILRESSRTWINIQDNLFFLKGKREFLWTSERSGFRHIYRYAYSGELIKQITSGEWEVRGVSAIDENAGKVYFLSSADSPTETQLYSTTLDGRAPSRITIAAEDHQMSVDPNGQFFVDTSSNLTTPPETVLRRIDGHPVTTLFKTTSKVARRAASNAEIVKINAPDGTLLYGLLRKPADYVEGHKYPVIVKVYGGPQAQSVRNEWHDMNMDDVYTSNGYVVWELDNRGSAGRGHVFEEPVYRKLGSIEVADQRTGVEYLIKRGIADPKRIGVTGWSYGGYMTIRCLLLAPQIFSVGVAGAPVTDWRNYDTIYTERYMGLPTQEASAYTASSNVAEAAKLEGRLLIQHNLEDDNVLFQNTMQFINALEEAGKDYSLQLYPLKIHGVTGDLRNSLYAAQREFFRRNLQ